MGKKTKVGKQRKDKYYQRAKEAGYRSRAAFKLIQLNRQFEFLQKSRVCIDLCAAPGGWMQVAKQNMPLSSIVLGVDLYPIKPIPGCISVTEDITTEKCRSTLAKELKTWKADVVLHDGAPNVGKNWLYDAFQQACLTLSALKLATSFLRSGGWFITKVFRSKDYHPLIWVLKQFFKKVHQTKPAASRNESAEIFVVCQHYLAPAKFDPKFMDPKYVFEEVEVEPKNLLNVFHPEKKQKKKPEGYPDNDISLYHKLNASDFIGHPTGIELLAVASEIVFDDPDILEHKKTTNEIKECCKDIKVLGRKELKNLLSWRKSLHEEFAEKKPKNEDKAILEGKDEDEDKEQTEDVKDEEEQDEVLKEADMQILELQKEEHRELKRKKKNVLKERKKLNEKLNLKMVIKGDSGPTMEADGLFELKKIKDSNQLNKLLDKQPDVVAEEEKDLTPKSKYLKYDKDEQHLDSSGLYYKNSDSELEFESEDDDEDEDQPKGELGYSDSDDDSDSLSVLSTKEEGESSEHPLITDLDYRKKDVKRAHKSELFFQRDAFKDLIDDKTMDIDLKKFKEKLKEKGAKFVGENEQEVDGNDSEKNDKKSSSEKKLKKERKQQEQSTLLDDEDLTQLKIEPTDDASSSDSSSSDSSSSSDDSDSDYDVEKQQRQALAPKNNVKKDGFEIVQGGGGTGANLTAGGKKKKRKYKLTPEELALGTLMINSKKMRRDIVDAGWNRYAFNDENLPDWFVKDEAKHMRRPTVVPEELTLSYKKQLEEINTRPIKKVVEAKARKKKRALKKLEKARKKAENILENADVSEREKARQIKQLYKKARQEPKQEITYVVAKKHMTAKRMKRPAGVKGRYKIVDARMKKDLRAQKNKEKTVGRGKKKSGAAKGGKSSRNSGRPQGNRKGGKK